MPLCAATLVAFEPDPQFPIVTSESFATDILAPDGGKEQRASLRQVAPRTLSFTTVLGNAGDLAAFDAAWYAGFASNEPLRTIVPLWPESSRVIGIAGRVLSCDTRSRDGFTVGATMLLVHTSAVLELVTIDNFDDSSVTVDADLENAYPIGATDLVPVMTALLVPPSETELNADAVKLPLTFVEELPGVAGIADDADGADVAPAAASVALRMIKVGNAFATRKYFGAEATVLDAAGERIEDPAVVWSLAPYGMPATPHISYPKRGQQIALDAGIFGGQGWVVTATVGAAAASITFDGV